MKFRMLFVAALFAMCSLAFAQPASVIISELDASLTQQCGGGACIPSGATVNIRLDLAPAGYGPEDPMATVGPNPQDWNMNSFQTNPDDIGSCGGFFLFSTWSTNAAAPSPAGPFYMELTSGQARWISSTANFASGPAEWDPTWTCQVVQSACVQPGQLVLTDNAVHCIPTCPTAPNTTDLVVPGCGPLQRPHVTNNGVAIPIAAWTYSGGAWHLTVTGTGQDMCFQWLGCEPLPCNASPLFALTGDRTHLGAVACGNVCVGSTSLVTVCGVSGALNPANTPITSFQACASGTPGAGTLSPWVYNPGTGCFEATLTGTVEGCLCIRLDNFLAANILEFSARAMDNSSAIRIVTASETNVDKFEVTRTVVGHTDAVVVGTIEAEHSTGGTYNFVDNSAANGTTVTYNLVSVDMSGAREIVGTTEAVTPNFNAAVITEYALHQNFPNPFNPTTQITFDLVNENNVSLKVFNIKGQEVGTVVNGTMAAGRHTVSFDATNLTSGLYFYTVKIGNEFTATKKMMLVK